MASAMAFPSMTFPRDAGGASSGSAEDDDMAKSSTVMQVGDGVGDVGFRGMLSS